MLSILIIVLSCNGLAISRNIPEGYYHSDVIVTKWPTTTSRENLNQNSTKPTNEPGWLTKQLIKFGKIATKIGDVMDNHRSKISDALDKICKVIKTVLPLLAAVCHVGQFGFCSPMDEVPVKLSEAMNPNELDLNSLDK